jgi:putative ABC transport system permease protein
LDLIWSDLKYACRSAAARPAFTGLVVATLALGIGVNSAVFALLDGVLWRSLPYRDPSRLVFVWQTLPAHNVGELEPTPFDYAAWRRLGSFESVALLSTDTYTLTGEDNPERVRGARVTSSLMPLLGIAPRAGRSFDAAEDDDSAPPTAVLGEGLWKRRFGGDESILGRSILVNGVQTTVVGIMAGAAILPGPLAGSEELWLPARMPPGERDNAISHNYTVVARLTASATIPSAGAEVDANARQLAISEPDSHRGIGARLVAFDEQTVRGIRPSLAIAAGGVVMLLFVACANVSTLLLARAANRRHEIALRAALGASSSRLLSLALAESLVMAGLGGAAGLALGNWALRFLLPLFAAFLPPSASIGVDGRVAAFTASLSVVLAIVFGVAGGWSNTGRKLAALKASSRTTGNPSQSKTRAALVVTQIALAVTLMSAAGLLLRSVVRLSHVSPGFDVANVLTFRLSLTSASYAEGASRLALVRRLLDRLSAVPGVQVAGVTSNIPFGGTRGANGVEIESRPVTRDESIIIDQRHVTPDYFRTMGIPLLAGRMIAPTDDERAEPVVVINRSMAQRYFPGASAIDRRVRVTAGTGAGAWCRIVGVTEDVRHISLSRDAVPEMYYPYAQAPLPTLTVVARTGGDPAAAVSGVREAVRSVDPTLPIYDVRTMEDRIARSMAQTRSTMILLLLTAALAAALAAVSIYGSVWYSVTTRTSEIGIRLALGATQGSVCREILRNALVQSSGGAVLGTIAVAAVQPLLAGFLFETPVTDPGTLASVLSLVAAVTTIACLAPAWRAVHIDPAAALRNE